MTADPDEHDDEPASEPAAPEEAPPEQPDPDEPVAEREDPADPLDSTRPPAPDAPAPATPQEAPEAAPELPGPGAEPALVERLRAQIAALDEGLGAAQRRADEMSAIARRQSDMVGELHGENRRLRDGEIREALAPLVRGLARLWDDLARMRTGAGAGSADLAFLEARVAELLHDSGVLPLSPELGAPFDPQVHQATGSATTGDVTADRTVAELRRAGLRRDDGRMLRPADVVVYRYVAPTLEDTAIPEEVA